MTKIGRNVVSQVHDEPETSKEENFKKTRKVKSTKKYQNGQIKIGLKHIHQDNSEKKQYLFIGETCKMIAQKLKRFGPLDDTLYFDFFSIIC